MLSRFYPRNCCYAKFERGDSGFCIKQWRFSTYHLAKVFEKLKFRRNDNDMMIWYAYEESHKLSYHFQLPPFDFHFKKHMDLPSHGGPRTFLCAPGTLLAIGGRGGQLPSFWWKRCWWWNPHVLGSKLLVLGMVIPPLIGNPYNGYINPYYWVDDHPLLYGNSGSLDPGTHGHGGRIKPLIKPALCHWCNVDGSEI